jgi:hypothetical protein
MATVRPQEMGPDEFGEAGGTLWAYWSSLPRRDLVPFRRDFDPMAIRRALPMVSLMENEATQLDFGSDKTNSPGERGLPLDQAYLASLADLRVQGRSECSWVRRSWTDRRRTPKRWRDAARAGELSIAGVVSRDFNSRVRLMSLRSTA